MTSAEVEAVLGSPDLKIDSADSTTYTYKSVRAGGCVHRGQSNKDRTHAVRETLRAERLRLSSTLFYAAREPPKGEINHDPSLFPQKFPRNLAHSRSRARRAPHFSCARCARSGDTSAWKARLPGGRLSCPPEPHIVDRRGHRSRQTAAGADRYRGASRPGLPHQHRRRPQAIHRWPAQISGPHRTAAGVCGLVEKLFEKPSGRTGLHSDGRAHAASSRGRLAGDLANRYHGR